MYLTNPQEFTNYSAEACSCGPNHKHHLRGDLISLPKLATEAHGPFFAVAATKGSRLLKLGVNGNPPLWFTIEFPKPRRLTARRTAGTIVVLAKGRLVADYLDLKAVGGERKSEHGWAQLEFDEVEKDLAVGVRIHAPKNGWNLENFNEFLGQADGIVALARDPLGTVSAQDRTFECQLCRVPVPLPERWLERKADAVLHVLFPGPKRERKEARRTEQKVETSANGTVGTEFLYHARRTVSLMRKLLSLVAGKDGVDAWNRRFADRRVAAERARDEFQVALAELELLSDVTLEALTRYVGRDRPDVGAIADRVLRNAERGGASFSIDPIDGEV